MSLRNRLDAMDRLCPLPVGNAFWMLVVVRTPTGEYVANREWRLLSGLPRFLPREPGVNDVPPRGFRLRVFALDVESDDDLDDLWIHYGCREWRRAAGRCEWVGFFRGEKEGDTDIPCPRLTSNKYRRITRIPEETDAS